MIKNLEASDLGIVDRLLVVDLQVSIWTARRKLKPQDLGDADLPPNELASLGSKKICDPKSLTIFNTLKARAIGVLELYGLEFMSGWAIPQDMAKEVHQRLNAIEREFNEAKAEFLSNYDKNVGDWIRQHPGWSYIIENSVVSADYVRSRFAFQSRFYSVAMPGADMEGASDLCEGFQDEVAGFGRALYYDVRKAATEAWENSFKGQEKVSHKALSPIRKIHDKLVSFSFVDPKVLPVTEIIQAALDSLPKRGYIEGLPLIQFQGLVSLLRDTEALIDLAERRMNGLATDDILAGFIPAGMLTYEESEEDNPVETELESGPPLAAEADTDQADEVTPQPGSVLIPQAPAPVGCYVQPSLLNYSKTIFQESMEQQVATAAVVSQPEVPTIPVTGPILAPAIQAEQSVSPDSPEKISVLSPRPEETVQTDGLRDDCGSQTEYFQGAPIIPFAPGGMGDFLDGFI